MMIQFQAPSLFSVFFVVFVLCFQVFRCNVLVAVVFRWLGLQERSFSSAWLDFHGSLSRPTLHQVSPTCRPTCLLPAPLLSSDLTCLLAGGVVMMMVIMIMMMIMMMIMPSDFFLKLNIHNLTTFDQSDDVT